MAQVYFSYPELSSIIFVYMGEHEGVR